MRLQLLVLLTLVRAGHANPAVKSIPVRASDLPPGVTVRGVFQSGVKFTDKNGTNYLLFGGSRDEKKNSAMLFVEDWVLTTQSVVLRGRPSDGVLAPPRAYAGQWVPFPPEELPNMGRFRWRD